MKFNEIIPAISGIFNSILQWFSTTSCFVFSCEEGKSIGEVPIAEGIIYFVILAFILFYAFKGFFWLLSAMIYTIGSTIGIFIRLACKILKLLPFGKHRYWTYLYNIIASFKPLYHYVTWNVDRTNYDADDWLDEEDIKEGKQKKIDDNVAVIIGGICGLIFCFSFITLLILGKI